MRVARGGGGAPAAACGMQRGDASRPRSLQPTALTQKRTRFWPQRGHVHAGSAGSASLYCRRLARRAAGSAAGMAGAALGRRRAASEEHAASPAMQASL